MKKVNRDSGDYKAGYKEGFEKGLYEGEAKQAIIEIRGRELFNKEIRAKIACGEKII